MRDFFYFLTTHRFPVANCNSVRFILHLHLRFPANTVLCRIVHSVLDLTVSFSSKIGFGRSHSSHSFAPVTFSTFFVQSHFNLPHCPRSHPSFHTLQCIVVTFRSVTSLNLFYGCTHSFAAAQRKNFLDNVGYFEEEELKVADDTKRSRVPKKETICGLQGNFKRLDID